MSPRDDLHADDRALPEDDDVLELLAKVDPGQPGAAFRRTLRGAFLAGFPQLGDAEGGKELPDENSRSQAGASSRSAWRGEPTRETSKDSTPLAFGTDLDRPHEKDLTRAETGRAGSGSDEEQRLVGYLSGQPLCSSAPQAGFREDLRRCFLSGEFPSMNSGDSEIANRPGFAQGGAAGRNSNVEAPSRDGGGPQVLEPLAPDKLAPDERADQHRSRFRVLRGVLVAAAAVLLMAVLLPREPQWKVHLLEGDGLLAVNGFDELIPIGDFKNNVDGLMESGRLQTRISRVQFTLGDELIVEFAPGSVVDPVGLVAASENGSWGRSRSGPWSMQLEKGEAYIHKSKDTADRPFLVHTPDLEAEVLGTVLGVLCNEDLTCVCVAEGQVDVRPAAGRLTEESLVSGGNSLQVLRHEQKPQAAMGFPATVCPSEEPHDHHVCGLLNFEARADFVP